MIRLPRSILVVAVTLALALGTSGCAKRPAVAVATAPAPTGAATPPAAEPARPEPAAAPVPRPAPAEFGPNDALRMIHFEFDKADIRPDARVALEKTASFLKGYPNQKVNIEGHCDERGSTEYNLALGDRRANAVKQYLVNLGIPAANLNTVSFGKEKPFCTESNETCWQQNRRGHFVPARQ